MKYTGTIVLEKEVGEEFVELFFEGRCYSRPGYISGAPEDCYPEDSDEEVDFIGSNPPGYIPDPEDFDRATRRLWRDAWKEGQ